MRRFGFTVLVGSFALFAALSIASDYDVVEKDIPQPQSDLSSGL